MQKLCVGAPSMSALHALKALVDQLFSAVSVAHLHATRGSVDASFFLWSGACCIAPSFETTWEKASYTTRGLSKDDMFNEVCTVP